jgi:hypothetical protein
MRAITRLLSWGEGAERCDVVARLGAGVMTLLLVVMLARVVQLQLAPGAALSEHQQARVTKRTVPASRGDIVDRSGRFLATSQFGYRAFVDPTEFPDPPDEAIARLIEVIGDPKGEVGAKIVGRMMINRERMNASGQSPVLGFAAAAADAPRAGRGRRAAGELGRGGGDAGRAAEADPLCPRERCAGRCHDREAPRDAPDAQDHGRAPGAEGRARVSVGGSGGVDHREDRRG